MRWAVISVTCRRMCSFSGTVALNIARMDATASSASIIKAAARRCAR